MKSKVKSKVEIVRLMTETPAITKQEIAEALGLSLAGIEKVIRTLKQQGLLRRIGPDKGGHWEVLPK
ncbi:MAG: winged helix-turn-helix transcriptional regulator, partial [bacterium]|nr:winged helix-turn-helix transcriptional regulator [bacterium]